MIDKKIILVGFLIDDWNAQSRQLILTNSLHRSTRNARHTRYQKVQAAEWSLSGLKIRQFEHLMIFLFYSNFVQVIKNNKIWNE